MDGTLMPTTELRLRLDDGLLTKARALAERRGTSLEDLLVVQLTRWVRADKRRRIARAMMQPYADRPTVSFTQARRTPEDDSKG